MKLSERFIKDRVWLKTHHFAVTNLLRRRLEASKLPVEEQECLAYVQNKILITAEEGDWAFIPRRYWAGKCGSVYKQYIKTLEEWSEIKINPSYRATHDEDSYPRSYRVPAPALAEGICNLNFQCKRFRPPVPDNRPTDDVSRYVLNCLCKLSVAKDVDFWLPDEPLHRSRVKEHCEHIAFKDFRLRYGRHSKRLFHRVVMMPSEGRCNLKHYCLPLVEYDVKSCHPLLLLTLFDNAQERKRYQELITQDIYTTIGRTMGALDRDLVKTDFLRVVNAGEKDPEWLNKQYVFNFFDQQFPNFTRSVLSVRTDLAIYLQNLEAELMVQRLGSCCLRENLFWIPQHDGFISIPGDDEKICYYTSEIIYNAVGINPFFTKHFLNEHGKN